jgi:biotin carboxylase
MMKIKKIIVLGASILQLPAILKVKEMGHQCIAVDMNKNAIGFKYADVCLEISTIDIPKVVAAAKQYGIDGVVTIGTDMPVRTMAAIASELNIVGNSMETAIKATNKAEMRGCLKQHNVPIPFFYKANSYEDYISATRHFKSRCIVKPVDNSGSRGVFLVKDVSDNEAVKYAFEYSKKYSRCGDILVEDYMSGHEFSVESLSVDGDVFVIAVTDKLTNGAPRFVELGHSQPTRLPGEVRKQVESVTIAAVKALGIKNGPSHTEVMVTSEGPKIVELGARPAGDNVTSFLVPLSTGVDMVKCCIQMALGQKPDLERKTNMGSAIRYFETQAGTIKKIRGVQEAEKIPGVKQVTFVKNVGDTIGEIYNSTDRMGFVIAQAETAQKAIKACEEAKSLIVIDVV